MQPPNDMHMTSAKVTAGITDGHTYPAAEVERAVLERLSTQEPGGDRDRVGDILRDDTESEDRADGRGACKSEEAQQASEEGGGPD